MKIGDSKIIVDFSESAGSFLVSDRELKLFSIEN
jgi:hypothetical protein